MKNSLKVFVCIVTLFFAVTGSACIPDYLRLNSVAFLAATGIYGSEGLEYPIQALNEEVIAKGTAVHIITDDMGKNTHQVQYLGSISDQGGIIQSSFLVLDFATGVEKISILKSNYKGGGVFFKGSANPKVPDADQPVRCAYP